MAEYDQILKEIKIQRQAKGLSQNDMADKLNISQSAYGKIETGIVFISIDRLHEICKILELNMFDLLRIVFNTDSTNQKIIAERHLAERNLEINQKWFAIVESMIHTVREKIDECLAPDSESKKPLVTRIEELAIKYQDLINTVDLYKDIDFQKNEILNR